MLLSRVDTTLILIVISVNTFPSVHQVGFVHQSEGMPLNRHSSECSFLASTIDQSPSNKSVKNETMVNHPHQVSIQLKRNDNQR